MPPIAFIGFAQPAYSSVASRTTFASLVPSAAQPGDTLLMVVTAENNTTTSVDTQLLPAGWSRLGRFTAATAMLEVFRRIVTEDEPASHTFKLLNTDFCNAMLLVYRGMAAAAAIVGGAVVRQAAGTAFSCPAEVALNYSDIYIGVCSMQSTAGTFTAPINSRERVDLTTTVNGVPAALEVFDRIFEVPGAIGAQVATASVSVHGTAGSFMMSADPAPLARMLVPDIKGAIGLPTIGV